MWYNVHTVEVRKESEVTLGELEVAVRSLELVEPKVAGELEAYAKGLGYQVTNKGLMLDTGMSNKGLDITGFGGSVSVIWHRFSYCQHELGDESPTVEIWIGGEPDVRPWVEVRDLAQLLRTAAERKGEEAFRQVSGETMGLLEAPSFEED